MAERVTEEKCLSDSWRREEGGTTSVSAAILRQEKHVHGQSAIKSAPAIKAFRNADKWKETGANYWLVSLCRAKQSGDLKARAKSRRAINHPTLSLSLSLSPWCLVHCYK